MTDHAAHANSFDQAADVYERGRPPYPQEALDWLLPSGAPRVVDLGAGTGKLTRQIAARGLAVTAVDPSPKMLGQLSHTVPGVPALVGTAEKLPLEDACAEAVLVAQAWHWVDPQRAVPEVARVLTPGGTLGLLWNVRDDRSDWVRRLGEIIRTPKREKFTFAGPPFGPTEERHFEWTHTLGPQELLDMVASRSMVILLPPDERAGVLREVRQLMATHPELVGRTEYQLPYITECARAFLPA